VSAVCPSCGAPQVDGLLCYDDAIAVETMLAAIPELAHQLDVAISKQAKVATGGKAGKGSAHERSPVNWDAVAVRDALLTEFALWAGDINDIRRHPQVSEIVVGIGRAVKDAYRTIDRMQDRQYLGQCMAEDDGAVCHAELWARPGAHQLTCSQCGTVHEVGARRAWLLEQAAGLLCTVKEASRYVGEVGGIRVTEASIRGYIHRGRIVYHSGKMLRLGDLLAVVLDESERRSA
jgi:hypothetical protein